MENMIFPNDPELLDRIDEGIFSLDTNWRFTYINRAGIKMLRVGKKREDLIGKNVWTEFPQLKQLPQYEEINNILEHRKIITCDVISPISHEWRHFAFYPGKHGISVVMRNIVKEKEYEKNLKKEKDWSTTILSSIQDGMVVVDSKLTYLYVNEQAEKMIGIPKEKLLGKKFIHTFPDHNIDLKSLIEVVHKAWLKKEVTRLELFFKPLKRWYAISVYPFDDKYSVIYRDITETKRLEEELYGSRSQLDIIFRNVSDGIFIQEDKGKFLYVNDAAAKASGYKNARDMLKDSSFDYKKQFYLFNEEDHPIRFQDLPARRVLRGEKNEDQLTIKTVDKETNKTVWTTAKSAVIPQINGEHRHVISITRDITGIKEVQQQKDDFLSMVSHELKTPITSMKVYMQILKRRSSGITDTRTGKILAKVTNDIDKLAELVRALLDVSRTKDGQLVLHKKIFSLPYLLQEVVEDIQPIAKNPITIITSKKLILHADRDRIAQVLINLVMNAIKYSTQTEKIILDYKQENKRVVVSVKDLGSGIPKKEQEEIFKKFYQSKKHKTFPGLGLGLYISSEIVTAHGGKIWVKSEEGKGSTFYFSLPSSS